LALSLLCKPLLLHPDLVD
ncbi:putative membrane protein, partial [Vibrio parahaemolyticus EKP-028]